MPAEARLVVDLRAVADNWRRLAREVDAKVRVAAVVKADAYGLGAARIAPALAAAGCGDFFVATLDEALALRPALPDGRVYVLDGCPAGGEGDAAEAGALPVLNDLGAIARWRAEAQRRKTLLDAVLHLDTGMSRLGLSPAETARLAGDPACLDGLKPALLMSHLACAEQADHPMNPAQRARFADAAQGFPPMACSLANSSGIFLGPDYHFDMVRPGAALYGINPLPDRPNPMAEVACLQGKIIAVRDVDSAGTVGYGATHRVTGRARIATVPIGYADGYPRVLGNRATATLGGGIRVPVVGRVSMDLITLDITGAPPERAAIGAVVDLIGGGRPVDDVAAEAGTIGYEILSRIGTRVRRVYRDAADAGPAEAPLAW